LGEGEKSGHNSSTMKGTSFSPYINTPEENGALAPEGLFFCNFSRVAYKGLRPQNIDISYGNGSNLRLQTPLLKVSSGVAVWT